MDSNSSTSVIADRKVLYKFERACVLIISALLSCMHSLDNSGLVLDVDHESSSKTQLQANASCGDDGCRHDLNICSDSGT